MTIIVLLICACASADPIRHVTCHFVARALDKHPFRHIREKPDNYAWIEIIIVWNAAMIIAVTPHPFRTYFIALTQIFLLLLLPIKFSNGFPTFIRHIVTILAMVHHAILSAFRAISEPGWIAVCD